MDINTGFATSVASGTSNISAIFSSVTGSTDLTVTDATLSTITITPSNPTLPRGSTVPATATGIFSDSTTQNLTNLVTWGSSDDAVASVSNAAGSQGEITAVDPGGATISATYLSTTGNTIVTVTPAVLVSIAITPGDPSAARGTTEQFTATGTYSDTTTADLTTTVAWTSSNTDAATVANVGGSEGEATALNVGTTTISAAIGNNNDAIVGTSL
ncbi:MAG: Ig-like domain-containing protein [Deltaproteobacteria bacterium]|nr:Ig-like domain-containing protein [Deltaproteobacteria bacterium]